MWRTYCSGANVSRCRAFRSFRDGKLLVGETGCLCRPRSERQLALDWRSSEEAGDSGRAHHYENQVASEEIRMEGRSAGKGSSKLSRNGSGKGHGASKKLYPDEQEDSSFSHSQEHSSEPEPKSGNEMEHANCPDDLHATKDMCILAFDVLTRRLENQSPPIHPESVIKLEEAKISCPLFVTWEKRGRGKGHASNGDGEKFFLRGCIGSLSPVPIEKLEQYSLKSALEDSRFDRITREELPLLRVKISLLLHFEEARTWDDWEIGKHGTVIKFRAEKRNYEATYLPEVAVEQGHTHEQNMRSLIKKSGYSKPDLIDLNTLKVTRYQSSKTSLTYEEYMQSQV